MSKREAWVRKHQGSMVKIAVVADMLLTVIILGGLLYLAARFMASAGLPPLAIVLAMLGGTMLAIGAGFKRVGGIVAWLVDWVMTLVVILGVMIFVREDD